MLVIIQYFVLRTEVSTLSNIICSCFGHRNVYQNIDAQLSAVLEDLIVNKGVDVFWTKRLIFAPIYLKIIARYLQAEKTMEKSKINYR